MNKKGILIVIVVLIVLVILGHLFGPGIIAMVLRMHGLR
jgi:hypothetical protein